MTSGQERFPPVTAGAMQDGAERPSARGGALSRARDRLSDRGLDPRQVIGQDAYGPVSLADFYAMLGAIAASEKAGQNPTHVLARLALSAGLPSEVADTLFLAYNQQSAEEAGHGDKVFGNAYYAMGGHPPSASDSAVGDGSADFLLPGEDKKQNKHRLCAIAGALGGIETTALQRVFPQVVALCEGWDHPIARDLLSQIRDTVRPEEARHVLIWRYVFHQLMAPKGDAVVDTYFNATNVGRQQVLAPDLDRESLSRMLGTSAPTARQLLGKERAL